MGFMEVPSLRNCGNSVHAGAGRPITGPMAQPLTRTWPIGNVGIISPRQKIADSIVGIAANLWDQV
jgi:hypothetical protein